MILGDSACEIFSLKIPYPYYRSNSCVDMYTTMETTKRVNLFRKNGTLDSQIKVPVWLVVPHRPCRLEVTVPRTVHRRSAGTREGPPRVRVPKRDGKVLV